MGGCASQGRGGRVQGPLPELWDENRGPRARDSWEWRQPQPPLQGRPTFRRRAQSNPTSTTLSGGGQGHDEEERPFEPAKETPETVFSFILLKIHSSSQQKSVYSSVK